MNVLRNCNNTKQLVAFLSVSFLLAFSLNLNAAETLGNSTNSIGHAYYLKAVLGLAFVIALFLLSTFLFKRFGNGPMLGQGQLRVVDGLHIGNRERLMLVEVKDKQILLAITPGKISKLDVLDKVNSANESDSKLEVVSSSQSSGKSG